MNELCVWFSVIWSVQVALSRSQFRGRSAIWAALLGGCWLRRWPRRRGVGDDEVVMQQQQQQQHEE